MTSLTNRPNVSTGTVPLRDAINSLFEQSFLTPTWTTTFGRPMMPGLALDIYEDTDNYYLLGVLPGVDPTKVEIVSEDNTLTISGEIPSFVPEGKQVVWHELPTGTFRRTLTLPMAFDPGQIDAQYENGLLKLIVPKAAHARPHKIRIGASQAQLTEANGNSNSNGK
jgi:HSP20 family protein